MGVMDRDYMRRPVEPRRPDRHEDDEEGVPLWEETADELRIQFHKYVRDNPPQSAQELAMLIEAATQLLHFHVNGQHLDKADPQTSG